MDSGLGSDEDSRGRTREQKQLRNQQLLIGCFVHAASLSNDGDVDQRRNVERKYKPKTHTIYIYEFTII